jgi:hypothetical protein
MLKGLALWATTKCDGIVHEGVTPSPHPMKTAVSAIFVGMRFIPNNVYSTCVVDNDMSIIGAR